MGLCQGGPEVAVLDVDGVRQECRSPMCHCVLLLLQRLRMVSEIMFHSKGHAAPPKVSLRDSNTTSSFGRLAQDWTADSTLRWQRR